MLTPAEVIQAAAQHIRTVGHTRHFLQCPPPHLGEVPEAQRPMCMYGATQFVIRTRVCRADWWRACAALDEEARARGVVDKYRHQHAGHYNDNANNSVNDILAFMDAAARRVNLTAP